MALKDKYRIRSNPIKVFSFKKLMTVLALVSAFLLQSCSYSFTGASIAPSVKSISVIYLPNNALLVQPTLSRKLTEAIRDKFTNQSNLALVATNGDLNPEPAGGHVHSMRHERDEYRGAPLAALRQVAA